MNGHRRVSRYHSLSRAHTAQPPQPKIPKTQVLYLALLTTEIVSMEISHCVHPFVKFQIYEMWKGGILIANEIFHSKHNNFHKTLNPLEERVSLFSFWCVTFYYCHIDHIHTNESISPTSSVFWLFLHRGFDKRSLSFQNTRCHVDKMDFPHVWTALATSSR